MRPPEKPCARHRQSRAGRCRSVSNPRCRPAPVKSHSGPRTMHDVRKAQARLLCVQVYDFKMIITLSADEDGNARGTGCRPPGRFFPDRPCFGGEAQFKREPWHGDSVDHASRCAAFHNSRAESGVIPTRSRSGRVNGATRFGSDRRVFDEGYTTQSVALGCQPHDRLVDGPRGQCHPSTAACRACGNDEGCNGRQAEA